MLQVINTSAAVRTGIEQPFNRRADGALPTRPQEARATREVRGGNHSKAKPLVPPSEIRTGFSEGKKAEDSITTGGRYDD